MLALCYFLILTPADREFLVQSHSEATCLLHCAGWFNLQVVDMKAGLRTGMGITFLLMVVCDAATRNWRRFRSAPFKVSYVLPCINFFKLILTLIGNQNAGQHFSRRKVRIYPPQMNRRVKRASLPFRHRVAIPARSNFRSLFVCIALTV